MGELSWQAAVTQGVIVALIVGIVQALKAAFLPSNWAMLTAYLVGVALGGAWALAEGAPPLGHLIGGLIAAQAAAKTYEVVAPRLASGTTSLLVVLGGVVRSLVVVLRC